MQYFAILTIVATCSTIVMGGCGEKGSQPAIKVEAEKTEAPDLSVSVAPSLSQKKYAEWIKIIEAKADKNETAAHLLLADYYGKKSFFQDPTSEADARKAAFNYAAKAAESGDPAGQFLIGKFYLQGAGTVKSDLKAFEWMSKSAMQEFAPAENELCAMYGDGDGVEKSRKTAEQYCQLAIKHGYPRRSSNLARVKAGDNTLAGLQALQEYIKGAPVNLLESNSSDGYSFKFGRGISSSTQGVFKLYKEAAIAGQPEAQRAVANMLFNGDGIESDYVLAYAWALIAKQSPIYISIRTVNFGNSENVKQPSTKEKNEAEAIAVEWKEGIELERMNKGK